MSEPAAIDGANPPPAITLRRGDILFHEGDRPDALFVVREGQLELLSAEPTTPLAPVGAGEIVGAECACAGQPAAFTARAVADTTVVRVDAGVWADLVRLRPEVARAIVAALGRSLAAARRASLQARPPSQAPAPGAPPEQDEGAPPTILADRTTLMGPLPRLVSREPAAVFVLPAGRDAMVGRADARARFVPDIDLAPLDDGRSLSRRHAVIRRAGDGFVLVEEPRVANGTFVNGERVKAAEPVPIRDGDELRFGVVSLTFRAGCE